MFEWEYDVLNDAGKEGLELVVITPNNVAHLKRQIEKPIAKPSRRKADPVPTK